MKYKYQKDLNIADVDYSVFSGQGDDNFCYLLPKTLASTKVEREIQKTNINYMSVLPGTGKTRWAKNKIVKEVNRKEPKYIIVYACPTKALQREVYNYLEKDLEGDKIFRVSLINSDSKERPANFSYENVVREAYKGDVILITHEVLATADITGREKDILLIVDEAGDFQVDSEDLQIDQRKAEFISDNLYFECIPKNASVLKKTKFDQKEIKDFFRLRTKSRAIENYRRFNHGTENWNEGFSKYLRRMQNPKFDFYVTKGDTNFNFYVFVSPSVLLHGYKSVYLLSAFFEHSELFHVLREKGYNLSNQSYRIIEQEEKIRASFHNLVIRPVLDVDTPLSKTFLSGLIFKPKTPRLDERVGKIVKYVSNMKGFSSKNVLRAIRYALTERDNTLLKDFPGKVPKGYDPMKVLLKTAKKASLKISDKKTLLVMNNKDVKSPTAHIELDDHWKQIQVKSHGLNAYLDYDKLAYFCALRPSTSLEKFYASFIPAYSPEDSWICTNILQSATRTKLRTPEISGTVNLFVATRRNAVMLQEFIETYIRATVKVKKPVLKIGFVSIMNKKEKVYYVKKDPSIRVRLPFDLDRVLRIQDEKYKKLQSAAASLSVQIRRAKNSGGYNSKLDKMVEARTENTKKMRAIRESYRQRYKAGEWKPKGL